MRHVVVLLVGLSLLLSGCAGGGGAKPASSSTPTVGTANAGGDNTTGNVGSIVGKVLDDENRPVQDAVVAIVKLNVQVNTAADGSFEFTDVPVGKHDVHVSRLGYEALAKKAEVLPGEPTELTFIIVGIAVVEPFYESVQRMSQHVVGETYVNFAVNLTGVSPTCEACVWVLKPDELPSFILWEVFGEHTVENPQGDKEHFWFFNRGNGVGPLLGEVETALPAQMWTSADAMEKAGIDKKDMTLWFQLLCENLWFCFQEKRESWITFFHEYDEQPEEFTAKPE